MAMIKGIPITLYARTASGTDSFNRPIYTETAVTVDNVLISPMSEAEILDTLTLTGRRAVYQLAIPKGDNHEWTDCKVGFFGRSWHVIGDVLQGIDAMIPLDWNKKIRVEAVDGQS